MTTAYVVMIGESPSAAAPTLERAQVDAEQSETRYTGTSGRELRWDECREGVWRLMSRRRDPATGKGRGRFAWTLRAVHAVPVLDAAGGGQ